MRLGNSRSSPTVAGLVLEHLCPAVQNILEDGLRHHKLDVVIGQQRNHSWRVVDASTQRGTNTTGWADETIVFMLSIHSFRCHLNWVGVGYIRLESLILFSFCQNIFC